MNDGASFAAVAGVKNKAETIMRLMYTLPKDPLLNIFVESSAHQPQAYLRVQSAVDFDIEICIQRGKYECTPIGDPPGTGLSSWIINLV